MKHLFSMIMVLCLMLFTTSFAVDMKEAPPPDLPEVAELYASVVLQDFAIVNDSVVYHAVTPADTINYSYHDAHAVVTITACEFPLMEFRRPLVTATTIGNTTYADSETHQSPTLLLSGLANHADLIQDLKSPTPLMVTERRPGAIPNVSDVIAVHVPCSAFFSPG
jgi:hypothetical protein